MKKIFIQTIIALSIMLAHVNAHADGIDLFYGIWGVDFERTLEKSKNNPKYSPEQADQMPKIIRRMMSRMKIRITESEMIYLRGEKEIAYPFSIIEESEKSARIGCAVDEQTFHIDFTLIDGIFMNFISSGSDDMNYYVWKSAEKAFEK